MELWKMNTEDIRLCPYRFATENAKCIGPECIAFRWDEDGFTATGYCKLIANKLTGHQVRKP
jgi:hypothetical protein